MDVLEEGDKSGAFVMCWTPAHMGHDGFMMDFLVAVWCILGTSPVLRGKGKAKAIAQNLPLHVANETSRMTCPACPAQIIIKDDIKLSALFPESLLDVYVCKRKLNFNREMIN